MTVSGCLDVLEGVFVPSEITVTIYIRVVTTPRKIHEC